MKQIIKKLAIVLSVALVCAPMGAMATDKLIVKDVNGANNKFVVTDTSQVLKIKDASGLVDKFVVTDTGKVGINVSIPQFGFQLIGSGVLGDAETIIEARGRTGGAWYDSPGFTMMRNNVVATNGGLPLANDRLGHIGFGSYIGGYKYLASIQGYAEAQATTTSAPTYLYFGTTKAGSTLHNEKMRITSAGNVGIGTTAPKSKLHVVGLPAYTNNAAAVAGGLTAGAFYRTGADPDVLCVVH